MKRLRLPTTAYGAVPPTTPSERPSLPTASAHDESRSDDRWTVRRSAFSRELILDAQALFEERLKRPVSENEARNLLGNLADYMWMLVQWEVTPPDVNSNMPPKASPRKKRGRPRKTQR